MQQSIETLETELINLFFAKQYNDLEARLTFLLAENPDWLNGWKILSDTFLVQGKDAEASAQKALSLNANDAAEHCYYGLVLKNKGKLVAANAAFQQAIRIDPNHAAAYNNLGIVNKDLGNVAQGVAYYRTALALNPQYADCFSNLLFCLSHDANCNAKTLLKEHINYSKAYEIPQMQKWPVHRNSTQNDRPLNIGFVSADFRDHSIAYCFAPLLTALAKEPSLNLFAYYNHSIHDDTTQHLSGQFAHWIDINDWSDAALTQQIKADAIDVLVDLSGHTAGNRLTAFALKPAPVQVSWFGYLATTGLKAMDYYLADVHLAPAKQFDAYFTEKIVQLPVNAPFQAVASAPDVKPLPALSNGYLTFGCFNRPSKISNKTIALWSVLLKAIPDAKLLLGAIAEEESTAHLIEVFESHGIAASRLLLHARSNIDDYLHLHDQVDICLDTQPSSGITTCFYAAWMGIPTLCIAGESVTSRGAMAIMKHLGLDQFVASDDADFVEKGRYWQAQLSALSEMRQQMRTIYVSSPIADIQMQSLALTKAFKTMWQTWCKRKAKKSFSVLL